MRPGIESNLIPCDKVPLPYSTRDSKYCRHPDVLVCLRYPLDEVVSVMLFCKSRQVTMACLSLRGLACLLSSTAYSDRLGISSFVCNKRLDGPSIRIVYPVFLRTCHSSISIDWPQQHGRCCVVPSSVIKETSHKRVGNSC